MTQGDDNPDLEEQIVENLRRVYRERVEEEVPDRFRDLLRMLKEKEQAQEADETDG